VRYATATAFRTALEQRLLSTARESGVPLVRLRKLVVFDRLLARLVVVGSGRWTLKGAVALQFRLGTQFRTTMDLDLARYDGASAARADLLAAESLELGDYFGFATRQLRPLNPEIQRGVVRYHVTAQVAGRPFEDITVDISLSDPVVAEPELLRGPNLLAFADIAPVEAPTLPLPLHIADKVHAYTRAHAGHPSTRVKDLVNLVVIARFLAVRAGELSRAIEAIFTGYGTHPLPSALPPPPAQWHAPFATFADDVGLEPEVGVAYGHARAFLDPVLSHAVADDATWYPERQTWDAVPC
jgi:hypothetical protein